MYRRALSDIYTMLNHWDSGNTNEHWLSNNEIVMLLREMLNNFLPEVSDYIPTPLLTYCTICSCGDAAKARQILYDIMEDNAEYIVDCINNGNSVQSGIIKTVMVPYNTKSGCKMMHPVSCINYIDGVLNEKINALGGRQENQLDYAEPWREIFGLDI